MSKAISAFSQRYPNLWTAVSKHTTIDIQGLQRHIAHLENGHFQHHVRYMLHLPNASYLYLSDNIEVISGVTLDTFITEGLQVFGRLIPERDLKIVNEIHRVAVNTLFSLAEPSRTSTYAVFQYRITRPDGEVRWVEQTSFPIVFGPDGGLAVEWGLCADITEAKTDDDICWRVGYTDVNGKIQTQGGRYNEQILAFQEMLTEREKEILIFLAQGCSSRDIAEILAISEQTVMSHRKNMLAKTHSANTAALVHTAARLGWVQAH